MKRTLKRQLQRSSTVPSKNKSKRFNLVLRSKFNLFLVLMHEGDWKQVFRQIISLRPREISKCFIRHTVLLETPFRCNSFSVKVIPLILFLDLSSCQYTFLRASFQNSSLHSRTFSYILYSLFMFWETRSLRQLASNVHKVSNKECECRLNFLKRITYVSITSSWKGFHSIISACPGEISLVPRDTPCTFLSLKFHDNLVQMRKIPCLKLLYELSVLSFILPFSSF